MVVFVSAVLCLIAVIAGYVWYKIQFSYWQRRRAVPSVPGKVFSGKLGDFLSFKTNFAYQLKTIYDDPEFVDQPVVGVYGLYRPSLLIRDPDLIKSILVRDFEYFRDRFRDMDLKSDPIGASGIFFTRYSLWKEVRSKLSPLFTTAKLKMMFGLIQNVAENMEQHLLKQTTRVQRVEMKDFCARYMTDIVATTLLGFQSNSVENPTEDLNMEIRRLTAFDVKLAINYVLCFFVPKLAKLYGAKLIHPETELFLKTSVTKAIEGRELSKEKRFDMIDLLVKLKKEAMEAGRNMIDVMNSLIAQAGVFVVGGFETSSTTMSNALLELAKHPEIQEKLKQEIRSTLNQVEGSKLSYEDINQFEYLDMIIHETLRLYPVFPILERVHKTPEGKNEPYSLKPYCDYTLPEDMTVFISVFGLNYDPKYWINPSKFDPERFSPANKDLLNSQVSLSFGMGPKNCIGIRLAMLQLKCGLIYLLKEHHVRLCEDTLLQPEFNAKSVVLQVKGGIHLEIVKD
ncbi:cytochrome P450 6g1-like [Haematobia irritans]|uniref:cytochrome P450 6g1-like n=1 Tax=Haematobia irritans TaxID=7368 RepID=UPI003F4FD592